MAKLTLFNRYGRIIYEETDYVNSWCGQDQDGNDLPTGTYYYVIQLDQNDPVFENNIKGWIYVNREVN
ncbi:gliding motility-associated C-terminal domain-containing protein [Mesonia maritima]|uniref:T9SS type B sorting domain-containing protein n=1 Tax=Mesonia maritima TaxID=1793873 RepID=UPI0036340C7B